MVKSGSQFGSLETEGERTPNFTLEGSQEKKQLEKIESILLRDLFPNSVRLSYLEKKEMLGQEKQEGIHDE